MAIIAKILLIRPLCTFVKVLYYLFFNRKTQYMYVVKLRIINDYKIGLENVLFLLGKKLVYFDFFVEKTLISHMILHHQTGNFI